MPELPIVLHRAVWLPPAVVVVALSRLVVAWLQVELRGRLVNCPVCGRRGRWMGDGGHFVYKCVNDECPRKGVAWGIAGLRRVYRWPRAGGVT
jgi:hypothetical protein